MELDSRKMENSIRISGVVKKHLGRGKTLGYPTANLDIDATDLEPGVFFAYAAVDGRKFFSLVFIGAAETFGDTEKFVEAYLLDFIGDLYGTTLELELLKKLRENQKFVSANDLIRQMKDDERVAREFFARYTETN